MLILLAGFSAALAAEEGPEQVIAHISDRLLQVVTQEGERLQSDPGLVYQLADDILVPHVDFSRVSSLVLGKHWQRATPHQQQAFSHQFKRLLVRTYSSAFNEFKHWEIRFLPSRQGATDDDVSVRTQLLLPRLDPVEVLYRMHRKEGRWLAYDVKIDGISLVTNYRSSFNRELRHVGMDGLIKKIEALNDKRSGNQIASRN
ncbi:MAG: ABC transporter substrate-binding protein [Gammaproteobacteria bacterium]|nr:ABC transporter substrate-binding protein [Gammaproteobacteria bacterium]